MRPTGTLLCVASGAAFGATAIFAKLAYDAGANVGTVLSLRFAIAAILFWGLLAARRAPAGVRPALPRRDIGAGIALGAFGYALQAGLYFIALERIDASVLTLLVYIAPAIVAGAAIAMGRESVNARRLGALALASAGLALVVAGAGAGELEPVGAGLGLICAVVYSTYILVSERVAGRVEPIVLAALVCTGATVTLVSGSVALGQFRPGDVAPEGWIWLTAIAVVSTVASISLFFAGLRRVGPTTASILSTVEPVVTVVLAYLVFAETLTVAQLAGGALVLAAVLVLQLRATRAAAQPAAASPSRSSGG